ncbi:MAG: sensor histidine kinase [Terriglobia bacterium]
MLVGGLFGVLLLLTFGAQSKALQRLFAQNHWALHSEEIRADLNAIRAESFAAEGAARGYVITGDSSYLVSFQTASARRQQLFQQVQRLTSDNAGQQERLHVLGILLARKNASLAQLVEERTLRGDAMDRHGDFDLSGSQLTQRIRRILQEMSAEEQSLLVRRSASAEGSAIWSIRTASLATVLALIILTLAGLALYRNIVDHNRVELELRRERDRVKRRTAQIEATNKELEAFSYSVSHDLRAPLRQIAGFAKLLAEGCESRLDSTGTHYLNRVMEGCDRMSALVEGLLRLARTAREEVARQPVNLKELAQSVIIELATEVEGRKVEWKLGDLPELDCDPVLVRQVFINLISNALKFSRGRSPGLIEMGYVHRSGEGLVFVRDNGAGFDMKYAGKLFGVFQRLHPAEEFDGVGIGLATVQRIVHKHGGRLWAEAEPDRGATFYFTLEAHSEIAPENVKSLA